MTELIQTKNELTIGELANQFASQAAFADYRSRKASNTIKRQDSDLTLFAEFLNEVGEDCQGDFTQAENWDCVTWGLVEAFIKWQLTKGYSVSSVNVRLSTIKTYARLAVKAGVLSTTEYGMIALAAGYSGREGKNVDETREAAGIDTRYDKRVLKKDGTMGRNGAKKAKHTSISREAADSLKSHPDTPQGRRDAFLMSILLDHGLRCGEVVRLTVDNINLAEGTITFYRPKVDLTGTHQMTLQTWQAAKAYIEADKPEDALILGSLKGGALTAKGMTDRAITKRVKVLGEAIGIERLSAHDCRHHAATKLAGSKTIPELMDIFGWKSAETAVRYVEAAQISVLE